MTASEQAMRQMEGLKQFSEMLHELGEYVSEEPTEITELLDIFNAKAEVPLDENLVEGALVYTIGAGTAMAMFSHPFYHGFIWPGMNEGINQMIRDKVERVNKFAANGQWENVPFAYERPFRTQVIYQIMRTAFGYHYRDYGILLDTVKEAILTNAEHISSPKIVFQIARDVWTDCENIPQTKKMWKEMFSAGKGYDWMHPEDEAMHKSLPEKRIKLYRGECDDLGVSWTRSEKVAKFFANRGLNGSTGKVRTCTVPKSRVFACFATRGEEEVIILPEDLENW